MSQEPAKRGSKLFYSGFEDGFESQDNTQPMSEGSVVKLASLDAFSGTGNKKVTTYSWNGSRYPVISTETVSYIARHLLNHNHSNGYSLATIIGHSGTGKTTLCTTLLHRVHSIAEKLGITYAIHWYRQQAIGKVDEIIDSLTKGVNTIIVLDDASWGTRDLTEAEAQNLLARLTYVRHDLKANVIVLIMIHYSKALGPFLRDGELTLITSISHEEKQNYLKVFGFENKGIINKFFRKYGSMMSEGYWYSELDEANRLCYYAKSPFKLALVSDFNQLHFTLYPAESCAYCEPNFKELLADKYKESLDERELFLDLNTKYGPTFLRQCLRYLFFFKAGSDALEPKVRAIMKRLADYYEKHPSDWQNTANELNRGRSVDYVLRERGILKKEGLTREELRRQRRAETAFTRRQQREINAALQQDKPEEREG